MIASNCDSGRAGQLALAEQPDVGAELRQRRRHLVADAHDVADLESGAHLDVDAGDRRRGLAIEVARLQIAILHDRVALACIRWPPTLRDRGDAIRALPGRRRRDREGQLRPLARPHEMQRRATPASRSIPAGRFEPQLAVGRAVPVVDHFRLQHHRRGIPPSGTTACPGVSVTATAGTTASVRVVVAVRQVGLESRHRPPRFHRHAPRRYS